MPSEGAQRSRRRYFGKATTPSEGTEGAERRSDGGARLKSNACLAQSAKERSHAGDGRKRGVPATPRGSGRGTATDEAEPAGED